VSHQGRLVQLDHLVHPARVVHQPLAVHLMEFQSFRTGGGGFSW
jgi:hypothetical protein